MAAKKTRRERWNEATTEAQKTLAGLQQKVDEIESAWESLKSSFEALNELKEEYTNWRDNLPENLQQSPTGEKLDAVADLDLDLDDLDLADKLSEVEDKLDEAMGVDHPVGFGRD